MTSVLKIFASLLMAFWIMPAFAVHVGKNRSTFLAYERELQTMRTNSVLPLSDRDFAASLEKRYAELFPGTILTKQSGEMTSIELDHWFQVTYTTVFYSKSPELAKQLLLIANHLKLRNALQPTHLQDVYSTLVLTRQRPEAKSMQAESPAILTESLPDFIENASLKERAPTEWEVSLTRRQLLRKTASLKADWQVIVISHPRCHFSERAMIQLSSDKALMKRLEGHLKWLAPQSGRLDFDLFQKWNLAHPEMPFVLTYDWREWSKLLDWGTPTFYFFANGDLITRFQGWPKEGNMEKFLSSLQMIEPARR